MASVIQYSRSRVLRTQSPAAEPQVLSRFLRSSTAEAEVLSDRTSTHLLTRTVYVLKGEPANFFVYYEIDDDESKHNLQLAEHGHQEVPNAWVLLEKA